MPVVMSEGDAELKELTRENTNYRIVFISIAFAVAGMGGIIVSLLLLAGGFPEWLAKISEVLGIAVFTLGFSGAAYEVTLRRHVAREVIAAVNVRTSWLRAGIVEASRYVDIPWRDFYSSNPGDIDVLTTFGSRHLKDMARTLAESAYRKGHDVRVLMVDPDVPVLLQAYADLYHNMSADQIRNEIFGTAERWRNAGRDIYRTKRSKSRLSVEFVRTILPATFYRSGENMWIVFNSGQHQFTDFLPAFRCRPAGPDGTFEWAMGELRAWAAQGLIRTHWEIGRGGPRLGWFRSLMRRLFALGVRGEHLDAPANPAAGT